MSYSYDYREASAHRPTNEVLVVGGLRHAKRVIESALTQADREDWKMFMLAMSHLMHLSEVVNPFGIDTSNIDIMIGVFRDLSNKGLK